MSIANNFGYGDCHSRTANVYVFLEYRNICRFCTIFASIEFLMSEGIR